MSTNYTLSSWKPFCKHFLANALGFVTPYLSIHLIWTQLLTFRHPMPFIGAVSTTIAYAARGVSIWFLFPPNLRIHDKPFRKRLLAYLALFPLNILIRLAYTTFGQIFLNIPTNVQWCLGVLLPVLRLFNTWISVKIAYIASGGKNLSAKHAMICRVGSAHLFCTAMILGSKITSTTAYVVMFLDGIPNIWLCLKIIKLHRQQTNVANIEKDEILTCLTIKEFLEVLIPATYCVSFAIAYYGPNAAILGNIQNDYWKYEKVEDITEFLSRIIIFFFIDAIRGLILSLILWHFCGMDVYKKYSYIVHQYGTLIFLYITAWMMLV